MVKKMNGDKAREALDRIFDSCEEVDLTSGYRMLYDVFTVQHYIDRQMKPVEWEIVYHDDNPSYYAKYVTARCSRCKHWYGADNEIVHHSEQYGVRLSSAFCMGYYSRSIMGYALMESAEEQVKYLPHFCENCWARMKGVRWDYESIRSEKK